MGCRSNSVDGVSSSLFALNKQTLEESRYLKNELTNELTESEYCLSMPNPNLFSEIEEKKMKLQRICFKIN